MGPMSGRHVAGDASSFERAMIGSISASDFLDELLAARSVETWSGMRPASIRDRSRISLMMPTRCRPFDAIRSSAFRWPGVSVAGDALQQDARVAREWR